MKSKLTILTLVLAVLAAFTVVPAEAQDAFGALDKLLKGEVASRITGTDTGIALLIQYVPTPGGTEGPSGLVEVAADGNLIFTSGTLGAEAADTTLECPVAAPLGGIIDVSNAACDTLGEVVDIINGSTGGVWKAVILDGVRTADADCTGNGCLLAAGATQATSTRGLPLYWDTSEVESGGEQYMALTPFTEMTNYLDNRNYKLHPEPYIGYRTGLFDLASTATYAGGAVTINIYSVKGRNSESGGSEVVTTLWSQGAGATTVEQTLSWPFGLWAKKGEKLVVGYSRSTNAITALKAVGSGTSFKY